nr:MAG TPA: hypothetical protein [Caudoviricetes sp.]
MADRWLMERTTRCQLAPARYLSQTLYLNVAVLVMKVWASKITVLKVKGHPILPSYIHPFRAMIVGYIIQRLTKMMAGAMNHTALLHSQRHFLVLRTHGSMIGLFKIQQNNLNYCGEPTTRCNYIKNERR